MKTSAGVRLVRYGVLWLALAPQIGAEAATALDATLSLTRPGCGSAPPNAEMAVVRSHWVATRQLQIDFWEWETASERISDTGFTVALVDSVLQLRHRLHPVDLPAGVSVSGCLFPVQLHYRVTGLARRVYRLDVGGTHAETVSSDP